MVMVGAYTVKTLLMFFQVKKTKCAHVTLASSLCILHVQAGKVYRMVMIEASTMKWLHMSFNQSGCVMGLYSRDANYLQQIPRLTDNLVMAAANRSANNANNCDDHSQHDTHPY